MKYEPPIWPPMPPRPGRGPRVAMESAVWAWLAQGVARNTRATTLASRKREFMLGKLLGKREIGRARSGRRGTLGGGLGRCQDACRTRVASGARATPRDASSRRDRLRWNPRSAAAGWLKRRRASHALAGRTREACRLPGLSPPPAATAAVAPGRARPRSR